MHSATGALVGRPGGGGYIVGLCGGRTPAARAAHALTTGTRCARAVPLFALLTGTDAPGQYRIDPESSPSAPTTLHHHSSPPLSTCRSRRKTEASLVTLLSDDLMFSSAPPAAISAILTCTHRLVVRPARTRRSHPPDVCLRS